MPDDQIGKANMDSKVGFNMSDRGLGTMKTTIAHFCYFEVEVDPNWQPARLTSDIY